MIGFYYCRVDHSSDPILVVVFRRIFCLYAGLAGTGLGAGYYFKIEVNTYLSKNTNTCVHDTVVDATVNQPGGSIYRVPGFMVM